MHYEDILLEKRDEISFITMNRPARRNALSLRHLNELRDAFTVVGDGDSRGVVLAGNGPVFSAGHDFGDMVDADLSQMRRLLWPCTELMETMQAIPQVTIARVHALATAAGCQLVASCDLAVASTEAGFATPGGKGGWFCHTPMVAVSRAVGRKAAMEMALCGDVISPEVALGWGLVNRVVAPSDLDDETLNLLRHATRGSAFSKGVGKAIMYRQMDLGQHDAYGLAVETMASMSQSADAKEGMASFLQKREPKWLNR